MKNYHYHTATHTILADLYTPVAVYMRLRDLYPQSALMESSDYHGKENSRSFIGIHPIASIAVSHGKIEMSFPDGSKEVRSVPGYDGPEPEDMVRQAAENARQLKDLPKETIAKAFSDFLSCFKVEGEGSHYCGVYGYTSFNAVRYFENIPVKDTTMKKNDAPDILYIFYENIIVFDHFNNQMEVIALLPDGVSSDEGKSRITDLMRNINKDTVKPYDFHPVGESFSTLTDGQHKANIRRCVAHCLRGDVFQIVISRRFCQKYEGDDFKLYRALRSINPSPYLFYFDFGGFRIFGSSPETHNRVDGKRAYIDPIAGTTKRTGDEEQDRKAAEFLRTDPKENAEHVMLVDLARNDLSRNCHDVKVDFYKNLQFYSHVIHLGSRVSGILNDGANPIREFFDTFPAGTLSGAPKVRAMQLISELEPHNRGAYGGCIGYIGLNGDLNQAIVIRTFISRNNELWFQAGSGVVAKSNDEYELNESNNKLAALVKAIHIAEKL